ncbi:MAG: cytochrome P450 [Planctomycetota bacterium]|nr:MAG: cytochrome P450 [Planctomycetota bacterium]
MSYPPGPRRPPAWQTFAYMRDLPGLLDRCRARFGRVFRLRLVGKRDAVVLADPDAIRTVFRGDPDLYHAGNQSFEVFFGPSSVLVLDGEEHRRHRRLLAPAFRGERMLETVERTQALVERSLRTWPRDRAFSLLRVAKEVTFEAILTAVFGPLAPERRAWFARTWEKLSGPGITLAGYFPVLRREFGGLSPWGRYRRHAARVDAFLYEAIAAARRGEGPQKGILASLVAHGADGLQDDELHDELLTIISAGHETTTAALGWTFQSVLADAAVEGRLRAELAEVCAGAPPRAEELARLEYHDAVVNESLRLNPPLAVCARRLTAPAELAGHSLPRGTFVLPCMHLVHRDPALYPEPLAFRPERFLGQRPSPFVFFPFGGGVRTCLGLPLALLQTKLVLATVLARTRLRLCGERSLTVRRSGVTLMPRSGVPVRWPREPVA